MMMEDVDPLWWLALATLAGALIGAAITWLVQRSQQIRRLTDLTVRLDERDRRGGELEREIALARYDAENWRAECSRAREEVVRVASTREAESKAAAEKQALLEAAERHLREAFEALSAQALHSNNQAFLDLARTVLGDFQQQATTDLAGRQKAIEEVVRPIRDSLEQVGVKLQAVEKERYGHYSELSQQLQAVAQAHLQLSTETTNLVKALRSPSARGRWGEMQLKRVVEMAGMLDHCDFFEQQSVSGEGGTLRPDLVVRLPGGKSVVVDAKAPLAAYLDALEATDDTAREIAMRSHARQVRDHIVKLGAKSYSQQFDPAPDFVVMFLPGETFFSAALQFDPSLIEFGVKQGVIPSSPTTLIALLRAVAFGWRQEKLAANAEQISRLGKELYDRIRTMFEHMERVRGTLDSAVKSFNAAVGSMETRVLPSARKLKELGAATGDEIDPITPIERQPRAPLLPPE